jgi:hypothetical protein
MSGSAIPERSFRTCFLPPIPELDHVATLLDQAANAILANDLATAERLVREADVEAVFKFAARITGPTDPAIHGNPPRTLQGLVTVKTRMPSARAQLEIFERDGWRCRFCSCRVVSKDARKAIDRLLPGVINWPSRNVGRHAAFFALEVTADHLLPHKRGGTNEPSNVVTACQCCQYGRNNWTIEEVGISDPFLRPPIVDGWDGLMRLVKR